MKRTLISIAILIALSSFSAVAQKAVSEKETWYVWIDTEVIIDTENVRIVSDKPLVITCCLKSAKYRKFVKKTAKWISSNVSPELVSEFSLVKIQDLALANEIITEIKSLDGVKIVDYQADCK